MNKSFRYYLLAFMAIMMAAIGGYTIVTSQYAVAVEPNDTFADKFQDYIVHDPPRLLPSIELLDLEGNASKLDGLKGKWRLVNFWATWCPGCVMEIPTLMELNETKGGANFEVVYISLDFPKVPAKLREVMDRTKIPADLNTLYVNDSTVWDQLNLVGVPTTIVVGPSGRAHFTLAGEIDWMQQESLAFVDELVKN